MIKKLISAILSMSLVIGCFSFASADAEAVFQNEFSFDEYRYIFEESDGGFLRMKLVDSNGNEADLPDGYSMSIFGAEEELPYKYDLREEGHSTSSKHQDHSNYCWAFSTMASAESNVLKQGLEIKDEWKSTRWSATPEIAFSPVHLGQNAYLEAKNSPGLGGDYLYDKYPGSKGGNSWVAAAALASGAGFQLENETPFSYYKYISDPAQRDAAYYRLKNFDILEISEAGSAADINVVKSWLVNNGACVMAYYPTDIYEAGNSSYSGTETPASHASTIIGWDDSFNSFDPENTPPAAGAWIIKDTYKDGRGEDGYFYLSYYDKTIGSIANVQVMPGDEYDNTYSYCGMLANSLWNFYKVSNVFTASGDETVSDVGIMTAQDNVSYQMEIYRGISDGKPDTGTLYATSEGLLERSGYHTISVTPSSSEPLEENEKFSVIFTLKVSDERASCWFEKDGAALMTDTANYGCEAGQTYLYDAFWTSGYGWLDVKEFNSTYSYSLGNAMIYAYTKNADEAVDKSELSAALSAANSAGLANDESSKIRSELWEIYENDLLVAESLYESRSAKQFEVDNAARNLTAVMNMLKRDRVKEISSAAELNKLSSEYLLPENGCLDKIVLVNDIELNPQSLFTKNTNGDITAANGATAFTPIGSSYDPFWQVFDGQNNSISGLYVNDSGNRGLFGTFTGTVKNMNIKDSLIAASGNVGTLIGRADYGAQISGCSADNITVSATGTKFAGGLVGRLSGSTQYAANQSDGSVTKISSSSVKNSTLSSSTVRGLGGVVGVIAENAEADSNLSFTGNISSIIKKDGGYTGHILGFRSAIVPYYAAVADSSLASGLTLQLDIECDENTVKSIVSAPSVSDGASLGSVYTASKQFVREPDRDVYTYTTEGAWTESLKIKASLYEISGISLGYDAATGRAAVTAPADGEAVKLIAARYDGGKMTGFVPIDYEIKRGTYNPLISDFEPQAGEEVKIILWDNFSKIKPLCGIYSSVEE